LSSSERGVGCIKIGVVTDDGRTVSPHFGMAQFYLVFEIEDGVIKGKEMRPKAQHTHHGGGHADSGIMHEGDDDHHGHGEMLSNVGDCKALIARGMGQPMHDAILQMGIRPYVTKIAGAEEAARAYVDGTLDDVW
jgi:predicted Fe-Mo cluster-binding NifX family protein